MKLYDILQESNVEFKKIEKELWQRFSRSLAQIAQEEYDQWDEDNTDCYAGGGICHFIADRFSEFFNEQGMNAFTESDTMIQHVYTVLIIEREYDEEFGNQDMFFRVDINPYIYEDGAGFQWSKKPDITFSANDVEIEYLGEGDEWYQNFEMD